MSRKTKTPAAILWLLDTNTISEINKVRPAPEVVAKFNRCQQEIGLPTPVWHEMQYGLLRMPDGQRKDSLRLFVQQVGGNLPKLPYDEDAARIHAELRADMARRGRTLPMMDSQIAAIAIASGCTLVTRNVRDFEGLQGLRLVNWFADE